MKKSKKYAAMMAAALLLSGTQLVGATADKTTYVGSGEWGQNFNISGDYDSYHFEGNGAVGKFYVYTNGSYGKDEADKAINTATFSNVTFSNNTVTNTGTNATTGSTSGGAAVFVKGADVTFENVTFTNNEVNGTNTVNLGGAVMVDGVRNNHNYTATATFKVTEDLTYSGNKVTGTATSASDTYGGVAVTSGGFLYLDRGSVVNFDIADGKTLTIGNEEETDPNTDSIASSIKQKNQTYSENEINKVGTGTLTVNGEMKDYHGDLNVQQGTMNINSSLASDSVVSVSSGATLNLKSLALSTSEETTKSVVSPNGTTSNVTTPEKSGALAISSGATVTADEITASDKTSVSVGEGASLSATTISASDTAAITVASGANVDADTITVGGTSTLNVESGATVEATSGITATDTAKVTTASGSNVIANLYLGNSTAVSVGGSLKGKLLDTNGATLAEAKVANILGLDTNTTSDNLQLKNNNHYVKMAVDENGNFSIQSNDLSKTTTDGSINVATLASWDADGNYDANGHKISNVGTLSAKTITLDGADLSDTLEAKADVDASNIGTNITDAVKQKTNLDAWGEALGTGTVASDSKQLISGETLYTELRPTSTSELHEVSTTNTTAQNLVALDTAVYNAKTDFTNMKGLTDAGEVVIRDIAEKSVIVKEGKNVKVSSTKDNNSYGAMEYTVDVEATGTATEGNTGLISGGTLYTALQDKADKNLGNLGADGINKVKGYAQEAVKVSVSDGLKIEADDKTTANQTTWKVSLDADTIGDAIGGQVGENNKRLVTGGEVWQAIDGSASVIMDEVGTKANLHASNIGIYLKDAEGQAASANDITANLNEWGKALGSSTVTSGSQQLVTSGAVYSAISKSEEETQGKLDGKANKNADNIDVSAWSTALGTGTVANGNSNLVTGGTLYTELRNFSNNAKIVSAEKTTAENLEALGAQADTNKSNISTNAGEITKLTNMTNLTDEGKKAVRSLASNAITVAPKEGGNIEVTGGTVDDNGNKTYTLSVKTGAVESGASTLVTGNAVNEAISKAIETSEGTTNAELAKKANVNADNIGKNVKGANGDATDEEKTVNLNAWGTALGTGTVAKDSQQLITGGTLYGEVRLTGTGYHYVQTTYTTAENLKALDDQVYTNKGNIDTNTGDITSLKDLSNISNDAKKVIQNANVIKSGSTDYITVTKSDADANGNITTTVTLNVNGTVAENDTGLVTGGTVYQAIKDSEKGTATQLAGKVDLDASNIGANLKDAGGNAATAEAKNANKDAWGKALGGGTISADSEQLVTGKTMYDELRPTEDGTYVKKSQSTAENLKALDGQVNTNTENIGKLQNMEGLTDTGVKNLKTYAQQAVQITGDEEKGVKVEKGDVDKDGNVTYKVSIDTSTLTGQLDTSKLTKNLGTGKVEEGNTNLVTGGKVYEAIQKELGEGQTGDYIKADAPVNANLKKLDDAIGAKYDSTNNIAETDNVKASIGKLDAVVGKVSDLAGIKGLPSAAAGIDDASTTVVDAVLKVNEKVGDLDPNTAYNYIAAEQSVNANLTTLDSKMGKLTKDGTYVKVDNNYAQNFSALDKGIDALTANIGTTADGAYVSSGNTIGQNLNALDQGLYDLNRDISNLGDRVNKVGAGAAALAALHPEGFDPDDKLSFAVGYGHYKNANASAIGAFYKPNANTTFSVASTVGNGNTMVNAGVSFKLGKSAHVEKTMVAKADYEALQQKVAAQDEKMAAQDAEIEELKKQVALLVAKG